MKVAAVVLSGAFIVSAGPVAAAGEGVRANGQVAELGMFAEPLLTGHEVGPTTLTFGPPPPATWTGWSVSLNADEHADTPEPESVSISVEPPIEHVRLKPRPKAGPFRMNLYEKGDFLHQQTEYWCVSASAQTMMNIIEPGKPNRSGAFQKKLHFEARDLDKRGDAFWRDITGEAKWKKGLHGLGLTDWAELLNTRGYGPYEIDLSRNLQRAIHKAAKSIRMTRKPVGLVVWRGAHAWVMSGFTATADPAMTNDYRVKTVFIQDPWYPWVSSIWGASRPPNSAVPVGRLSEDFLRYNRPRRNHPKRDGKFIIIEPTLPPNVRVG